MGPLSRDEVRALDRCAIQRVGVPGVVLMENAGRNAADAVEGLLGGVAGKAVAIVAGGGNNGGDGFVVARHLARRGARVATFLVADPEKMTPDAAVNFRIIEKLGHDVRHVRGDAIAKLGAALGEYDVIVDAVGGTGIRGALRGDLAAAVEQINAAGSGAGPGAGRPVVAVDIPTGLDCDTGQAAGPAVRAVLTVTFLARKRGFDAPGSSAWTGEVRVADIGIPAEVVARIAAGDG